MTIRLRYAARSDVGLLRGGNEDSVYAGPRLLAVADGMGGHAAGEVASKVAIAALAPLDHDAPGSDLLEALRGAVRDANSHLRDMVAADTALEGMGTTLTALLRGGQKLGLVHLGDSRAYLLRDGQLTQVTKDHTLVQSLVDEGRISAEEASTHPQRSLITRALDGRGEVDPDLSVREAVVGDRWLLCTDGLSGVVSEETLRQELSAGDPQGAVDRLVELALRGGGPDNVTVIVADVVDDNSTDASAPVVAGAAAEPPDLSRPSADTAAGRAALAAPPNGEPNLEDETARDEERPRRRRLRVLLVLLAAVVLLGGLAAGGWAYLRAQWYVGSHNRQVAIFQGVDGSLLGLSLASLHENSRLPVDALQPFERERVLAGISVSSADDARRIVARLKAETCPKKPSPVTPTRHPATTGTATPRPATSASAAPRPSPSPTASPIPGCEASP